MKMNKRFATRLSIICAVVLSASVFFPWRQCDNANNDGGKVYGEELTTAELPTEYLEAYDLFLKANITDVGEYTYDKAIDRLNKVIATTDNQDVILRCYCLVSFSRFLQGNFSEAYKAAVESVRLARARLPENSKTALIDKIKQAVENKKITDVSTLVAMSSLDEEGSGLVYDLIALYSNYGEQQELAERCWSKYCQPEFDKRVKTLLKEWFSQEERDRIKKELAAKYSKKGCFHPSALETDILAYKDACLKARLNALVGE